MWKVSNMLCGYLKKYLSFYNDGELKGFRLKLMKMHVSMCPKCGIVLEQMNYALKCLSGLSRIKTPDYIYPAIERRIKVNEPQVTYKFKPTSFMTPFMLRKAAYAMARVAVVLLIIAFSTVSILNMVNPQIAVAYNIQGQVMIRHSGEANWHLLKTGAKIYKSTNFQFAKNGNQFDIKLAKRDDIVRLKKTAGKPEDMQRVIKIKMHEGKLKFFTKGRPFITKYQVVASPTHEVEVIARQFKLKLEKEDGKEIFSIIALENKQN